MDCFREKYTRALAHIAAQKRSDAYKLFSMCVGAAIFLALLPFLFFQAANLVIIPCSIPAVPRWMEWMSALADVALGLGIVAWAAWTQWTRGHGTPAPIAPTQQLVTSGAYAMCRNPIELGAVLYFLGTGTIFGSVAHGIVCMALGLIVGSAYHFAVEEKELRLRFGEEYEAYRKRTPFLIPRLWKK